MKTALDTVMLYLALWDRWLELDLRNTKKPSRGWTQPGFSSATSTDTDDSRVGFWTTGKDSTRDRIGCSWNLSPQGRFNDRTLNPA
jgi:hypothetical protein